MQRKPRVLLCPFFPGLDPVLHTVGHRLPGRSKMGFVALRPMYGCKFSRHLLVICWCAGLFLGMLAAHTAGGSLAPLIRSAMAQPLTISGVFVCAVLPFALSAFAVLWSKLWMLFLICGWKAFGFGFCTFGVCLAFGSADWLVRFLFLFSDVCLAPVILFYWLRHIPGDAKASSKVFGLCFGAVALVGALDYFLISPFLVKLMNF